MKLIAVGTFLAFAVLAVAASAPAQEAPEEGSNLNDPAASVQAMVEASVAGRPVHVGTPVRESTKWFPGDGACHFYCPQGTVLISTLYEDPGGAGDCQAERSDALRPLERPVAPALRKGTRHHSFA